MAREKKASEMIPYLEERINCANIIGYIDRKRISENVDRKSTKLIINNIDVLLDVVTYGRDLESDKEEPNEEFTEELVEDELVAEDIDPDIGGGASPTGFFTIYDFMTESNYNGFEYFPYIYGILNCSDQPEPVVYTFYEFFENNLVEIISNMEHASEWYDIVFQMAMINYYIQIANNYNYEGGIVANHLCHRLPKPYYKQYELSSASIKVSHRCLIVLWNVTKLEKTDNPSKTSNIWYLLNYVETNKDNLKIKPSERIMKLLVELHDGPSRTLEILEKYYRQ